MWIVFSVFSYWICCSHIEQKFWQNCYVEHLKELWVNVNHIGHVMISEGTTTGHKYLKPFTGKQTLSFTGSSLHNQASALRTKRCWTQMWLLSLIHYSERADPLNERKITKLKLVMISFEVYPVIKIHTVVKWIWWIPILWRNMLLLPSTQKMETVWHWCKPTRLHGLIN